MSAFRNFIKKYFSFNRRERNGIIALLSIITLLTFSLIWLKSKRSEINVSFKPLISDSVSENDHSKSGPSSVPDSAQQSKPKRENALFVFDPNTVTKEQALQLGFSEKVFNVLQNFRSKGGKFRKPEDMKKVYGVSEKLFEKLSHYILIDAPPPTQPFQQQRLNTVPPAMQKILDINSADSLQLVSLNGIGPTLCRRILIFRNMLGGFHSKEQLKEVYGMRDSLYALFSERIMTDASLVKKIKINTATIEELKKHAYIKFMVAQSIVNYREKHGKYTKAEDLMKVGSLSDEAIHKLAPYLEF